MFAGEAFRVERYKFIIERTGRKRDQKVVDPDENGNDPFGAVANEKCRVNEALDQFAEMRCQFQAVQECGMRHLPYVAGLLKSLEAFVQQADGVFFRRAGPITSDFHARHLFDVHFNVYRVKGKRFSYVALR